MITIGSRSDSGVHYRAVPAILRRVGVGQHLKFGDAVHAERGSHEIRSGTISPDSGGIGAVDQKQFALRPAAGDRESLWRSESEGNKSRGAFGVFLRHWLHSRCQQRQLDEI